MEWTVYLFSDTGRVLWQQNYQARNDREAERIALKLVKPHLHRFPDAEDWVYEPAAGGRRASRDVFTGPSKKRQRVSPRDLAALEQGVVASSDPFAGIKVALTE